MIVLSGNVVPGLSREAQHQSCIDGLKAAAALVEGRKIATPARSRILPACSEVLAVPVSRVSSSPTVAHIPMAADINDRNSGDYHLAGTTTTGQCA
jgi:hypothetical protein